MSLFTPVGPRQAGVVSEVRFDNRGGQAAVATVDSLVDLAEGAFEGRSLSPTYDRYFVTRMHDWLSSVDCPRRSRWSPRR